MKRIALPLVLALSLAACRTADVARPPEKVVIVGTTDVHGWFNGHVEVPEGGGPGVRYGGLAILANYVSALRAEYDGNVLLVDSGDMFQGTLESNLFEGESVVRGYNKLGYSGAAVGNHEFDFGPLGPASIARKPGEDPLGALKRNATIANFPFLSANLIDKSTGKIPSWVKPYTIVRAGRARIGIIGLSTPDTPNVTMRANVLSLEFTDPLEATIRYAKELRSQNVDAVIVIAHIGGRCSNISDVHSLDSCDRQQEAMQYLESMPPGTIDAFFGGHTHAQMRQYVNGIATLQALAYSREFSTLELWVDPSSHKVLKDKTNLRPHTMICSFVYEGTEQCDARKAPKEARLIPRTFEGKVVFPDPELARMFEPYLREVAAKRNEKLGIRTTATFTRSYTSEATLGNLVTDALRESTGSDIAFFNSGGIRADLRAGDLVYGDIFEVSPFDNYPAIVLLTGKQVVEAIRMAVSGGRGLMQVSGLRYTVDANIARDKPSPDRNPIVEITLGDGSPIDPDKQYRVAMPDFIAAGGDGLMSLIQSLPDGSIKVFYDRPIREYMVDALRKRGSILTPILEGRVTVLNLPPEAAN
jgi:5'-nucleotidase